LSCYVKFADILLANVLLQDHQILVSRPHLPEEGPIKADPAPASSEAPEADESQDGDDAKESREESASTTSPPPAVSEDGNLERKRKHVGDVASTSTSVMKETSGEAAAAKDPEPDMFELLDLYVCFSFIIFLPLTLSLLLDDK
jgi:hypothetical protein